MNITFNGPQRHTVAQGLLILAAAIVFVTVALAAGSMPSGFTVRAEILVAFAQGALGA